MNAASIDIAPNTAPVTSGAKRTDAKPGKEVVAASVKRKKVALAFEGGGFPAGAFGAGAIKGLVEKGLFGAFPGAPETQYDIVAFSGTSAGALLAALCWAHLVKRAVDGDTTTEGEQRRNADLATIAARHAAYYAFGNNGALFLVPDAKFARALTVIDAQLREFPVFDAFRQLMCAPQFHMLTRDWVRASLAAILHPDDDPLDRMFAGVDKLIESWAPISDRLPSVPLVDPFFKPDAFYKTYQSWMPSVPQIYTALRAACCADLLAYNLRRMRYGDPVAELQRLANGLKSKGPLPTLLVGSSNIFRGEDKTFSEEDFLEDGLGAIVASGSLDEVNGWTIIKNGKNQGIYLDGAWGSNPPLSEFVDRVPGLEEIWLVEFFPKYHGAIPATPLEREERRNQLWQNSLVEHEIEEINDRVRVRRITHNFPTEPKSTVVNNPKCIGEMMNYGYAAGCCFAGNL